MWELSTLTTAVVISSAQQHISIETSLNPTLPPLKGFPKHCYVEDMWSNHLPALLLLSCIHPIYKTVRPNWSLSGVSGTKASILFPFSIFHQWTDNLLVSLLHLSEMTYSHVNCKMHPRSEEVIRGTTVDVVASDCINLLHRNGRVCPWCGWNCLSINSLLWEPCDT